MFTRVFRFEILLSFLLPWLGQAQDHTSLIVHKKIQKRDARALFQPMNSEWSNRSSNPQHVVCSKGLNKACETRLNRTECYCRLPETGMINRLPIEMALYVSGDWANPNLPVQPYQFTSPGGVNFIPGSSTAFPPLTNGNTITPSLF